MSRIGFSHDRHFNLKEGAGVITRAAFYFCWCDILI